MVYISVLRLAESASSQLQSVLQKILSKKAGILQEVCLIWFVHSYITHKTWEAADPAALDNWGQTPRSRLCTSACSTSSAGVPPQIVLSAMVCLRAVFHYPASVSSPLQDWPHLNMPRHHLLLNGPLWSKCQTGKLLKKKCSHLLSWHFPPRPIPPLFLPLPASSWQETQQRALFYPH